MAQYQKIVECMDDSVTMGDLLNLFTEASQDKNFHPHDFSEDFVFDILKDRKRKDMYFVHIDRLDGCIMSYGLLRGFDEGYNDLMLGIYVSKKYRGMGYSHEMMDFLESRAKLSGATALNLKVYKNNEKAVGLYKKRGYSLSNIEDNQYLGTKKFETVILR